MRIIILLLSLTVLSACGSAVQGKINPDHTITGADSLAIIYATLDHGDWLVARGIHKPDGMVVGVTNMALSHAAIYDKHTDEVIEADSNGVHSATLVEFLSRSHRVIIIRPIWATGDNPETAVRTARGFIGSKYDYTGLVGLGSANRYYCTELVIAAYRPVIEEKPANPIPNIIMPGQMYHWGRIIYDSGPYGEK